MSFRLLVLASLVALLPATALADAIEFQIVPKVLAGSRERPRITIRANEPVGGVEIVLAREGGKTLTFRTGRMKPGASRTFPLELPPGPHRLKGRLTLTLGDEQVGSELDFEAEVVEPAVLTLDRERLDLENRKVVLASTRKTAKVDLTVVGDDGRTLAESTIDFEGAAPGTPLEVTWGEHDGTVMKIALRVHDPDNFFSGIELYPWSIQIPHEEVNFASGSAVIERSETPKLQASAKLIQEAIRKYGRWADLKLYIAGHTDTVGTAESNLALSVQRARAISAQLRRLGVRIPIYYEGFGEAALAVPTPDETDELRNRRAEYIVAIEQPAISNSRHTPSWKRLD